MLEGLGLDLTNENYKGTPKRMVKLFLELCQYLYQPAQDELKEELSVTFPDSYKGMMIQKNIKAYSICSHHLLPVTYDITFGYIPKDRFLGFSKITKAIKLIASKPANQEDFTQGIIDIFKNLLVPKGIGVVVHGVHDCMLIRSTKTEAVNITSALRGQFEEYERTRNEFFSLAQFNQN